MALYEWSRTASSNANADPTINWAEGQLPSSVNDSARAMMARTAEWRDDISGALATSGSSTAYTVTSNQSFDTLAHMDNAMIAFVPHTTNGAAATLSVDGLTAKKIRMQTGVDIPDGVLIEGTPYVATYYNTAGEFILHGLASQPYSVPLGGLLYSTVSTPPNSAFVLPYGQAISRTTYADYFGLVGTTFGSGDGSTTFNVADVRGRAIFGLDNMGGTSADRLTGLTNGIDGDTVGATGGKESTALVTANLPPYTPAGTIAMGGSQSVSGYTIFTGGGANTGGGGVALNTQSFTINGSNFTGTFTGTPQGGTSTAFNNLPPGIILPCFLRVI